MKLFGQIAIASTGLAMLAACETTATTGPSPESMVSDINTAKVSTGESTTTAATLNGYLSAAETKMNQTAGKPALNMAWTFTAMTAAEALTSIPGQSSEAFSEAAGKTLQYADRVSTACLDMGSSGIDARQGNFCGMALAVRRLNDSSKAVEAFSTATSAGDWTGSAAASEGFNQQVATNWAAYAAEADQLSLSEQNQTPFNRLALQEACELQNAQGQANLLGNPSMDDAVLGAQDAYWSAMASAASFLDISSSASVCESDPEGIACKRETEIKVAETCQAL